MGHEYVSSHRALRQLAARLCGAGFPTLRFDYYGCGDSTGTLRECRITEWLDNISMAISEARSRSSADRVCLVGLRLGASLSLMASENRNDIASLVLWDPVLEGKDYVKRLLTLRTRMLRFRLDKKNRKSDTYSDIFGFPLSRLLSAELENLSLLQAIGRTTKQMLLVDTAGVDGDGGLNNVPDYLVQTSPSLEYQRLEGPQVWMPTENGSLLVPLQILNAIVDWVSRVH